MDFIMIKILFKNTQGRKTNQYSQNMYLMKMEFSNITVSKPNNKTNNQI